MILYNHKEQENNREENKMKEMINMIASAYIKVYGIEKWNGLSDKEKHDVVMFIANDLNNRLS